MADRKKYIVDMIANMISGSKNPTMTAGMIVERMQDEGLLVLGFGDTDVDRVIETFKKTFGTTKATKYDRFAANRMCSKYGAQSVCGVITLLASSSAERFAPVVGSVSQLEEKWVSVLNFLRQDRSEVIVI